MKMRIGVDVGGTFADIVMLDAENGKLRKVLKIPTIADSLIDEISRVLEEESKGDRLEEVVILHGTTLGLNTLLQERGSRIALITTKGFRDTYEIGRQWRGENVYDLYYTPPKPLVPRHRIFEVDERIDSRGNVYTPLDVSELEGIAKQIRDLEVEAVAVCLLFSFLNPVHEVEIKDWFAVNVPEIEVSLSCQVAPEFREFERTSTVAIDAYVKPTVRNYLSRFSQKIGTVADKTELYIMRSAGGLATIEEASGLPAQCLFSGPVGGVMGTCNLARQLGYDKVITLDMGGTSTDVALVLGGEAVLSKERTIDGRPVNVPSVEVHSIGSGGGSIASTLAGRVIQVGPRSAGAMPGPACYGRGGTLPTLTDAWLVLGHLEETLLDGKLKLDRALALAAIQQEVAAPLGIDPIEAASEIVKVAISQSYELMRLITVERGHDPKDFHILSFGGAGPVYTAGVAAELGAATVCIPHIPGLFSAAGFLASDLTRDFTRSRIIDASVNRLDEINSIWKDLEHQAMVREPRARLTRYADLRYAGQAYEVMVPVQGGEWDEAALNAMIEAFHDAHERRFGMKAENERVQSVVYRVRATLDLPKFKLEEKPVRFGKAEPAHRRTAVFDGQSYPVDVYRRDTLSPGDQGEGPAIITEYDTTTLVYPSQSFHIDGYRNIIINVNG